MTDAVAAVKYVGPHPEVEIATTGQIVKNGEIVEVPSAVAGRAPTPPSGEQGTDSYVPGEPGAGLLAQPDNWQATKASKAPAAKDEE